jgi:hypothetical protein
MTVASPATTGAHLGRLLVGDALAQARRLLAGGRVDNLAWHRTALSGDVVAPNGRRHAAWLLVDRERRLQTAGCVCSPKLRPGTLCPHLVALVLAADDGAANEPTLPGERFERSPWLRAADALFEARAVAGARAGEPEVAPLTAAERRLVDLTRTPEEQVLVARRSLSRRQALEASPWWLAAKRAFASTDGRQPAAPTTLTIDAGRLYIEARTPGACTRLELLPRAVDALHRETPELLPTLGLPIVPGSVRPALRLELHADSTLDLIPVYLVERRQPEGGALEIRDRTAADGCRYGCLFVLAEERVALAVEAARRPFVEPEAGVQATVELASDYRPSPIGQSLEQRTRVPADLTAAFLTRHSAEIGSLPAALLPPALAGGGPAEPSDAELVVCGEAAGRYELDLVYRIQNRPIPWAPIRTARGERAPLLLVDGVLIDPAHPRFAWMDALAGNDGNGHLRLTALEVCRLRSYLPVDHQLRDTAGRDLADATDGSSQPGQALSRLAALAPDAPPPPPESFGIPLFDFQRTGYAWLWFLWRHGFGGVLADDMGLGKTYQAIALMAAIAASDSRPPRILVVCPASVLPHWEEKLQTLVPRLAVRRLQGADRHRGHHAGILLTTYGTLRNDAEELAGEAFDLFVLDEMQTIKNRDSATHRALRALSARVAIGLSGTPVENSVVDLHTLVDFVLPGYLPDTGTFDRTFARPIADGDPAARARLARLVRPFILRRTKQQVLTGLPPKLEDRRLCAMTVGQADLYQRLLADRGAALRTALDTAGPVPYLHVFALLSKLKQLCNHPDLLLPPGAAGSELGSGKWELFTEILDEALGSGLKVVVFSQYLRMLDLIAAHLDQRGIGHATVRGSTADRATPVRRFRDDADCRVFLASLKAAGVGIDLTAASVVIHYDRWWNQAREDQATDRVHRFGQQRGVQVVTLITAGTIEERIDQLIADKGRLAGDLVPEEDAGVFRRFSRDELRQLLAP